MVLEQVNSFGSLPHRKQAYKKPLRRSKSDASTKKLKRNSIFNFFNSIPASTNLISTTNNNNGSSTDTKTNDQKIVNNKKVGRSKSDISSQSLRHKREKYGNKLLINENNNNNSNLLSSDSDNNNTSSSLITNSLTRKKIPLSPITEVQTPLLDDRNCSDYFQAQTNVEGVEDCKNSLNQQQNRAKYLSKSMESMHSSQMPVEKLPLTKHVRVDKIIKRLSVERLSPPPIAVLQAGGFSYTNPQLSPKSPTATSPNNLTNNTSFNLKSMTPPVEHSHSIDTNSLNNSNKNNHSNIVYTQVVCNDQNKNAAIQNNDMVLKTSRKQSAAASPSYLITKKYDTVDFINTASTADDKSATTVRKHTVDEFGRDEIDNIASTNEEEPIIKANIRKHIPRYSSNTNIDNLIINNNQQQQQQHQHQNHFLDNEFDRLNEMRETDYNNGIDATLSSRREILESRIKSRIGGLHINNDNNHHTRSNPPTIHKRTYNKHGSNEFINNRFSPERKHHLDHFNNKSSSPTRVKTSTTTTTTYLDDGSMRKNSHHSQKFIDKYTDSGNETDIVVKNNSHNSKNRYSSRFNIGYLFLYFILHAHVDFFLHCFKIYRILRAYLFILNGLLCGLDV